MDVSWMKPLIDRIEANAADIAYAYLQLYYLDASDPAHDTMLAFMREKEAQNKELLRIIQQRIDDVLAKQDERTRQPLA